MKPTDVRIREMVDLANKVELKGFFDENLENYLVNLR